MRIWHQSFIDMTTAPAYAETLATIARDLGREDTEVIIHGVEPGTYGAWPVARGVRHVYLHHLLEGQVTENARQAEREGYDAFAIVTLQDPGLRLARSVVDIPVVGYGESAMLMACMLGDRFGIVAFNEPLFPVWREQIRQYGLESRSVPTTLLEADYPDLMAAFNTPDPLVRAFEQAARRSIALGAEVIIPGQALLGALLTRNGVTRIDDAPVVDPLGASIKTAEAMVDLQRAVGLSVSRRGFYYERPEETLVNHMRDVSPRSLRRDRLAGGAAGLRGPRGTQQGQQHAATGSSGSPAGSSPPAAGFSWSNSAPATGTPERMTTRMRSGLARTEISASGSPSTTSRSAILPASSDPSVPCRPSARAAVAVAAVIAAKGVIPSATRCSSSRALVPCG
jgi:allantoin racemase